MTNRILIIDDMFGRGISGGHNPDRENLCAHFLWSDVTNDASAKASHQRVLKPTADVVFCRGQTPATAEVGALVENDLPGALEKVREGWTDAMSKGHPPWTMVLLDLCFYTGRVTAESHRRTQGIPEGSPIDDDPRLYFGLTLLDAIHREFPELPVFIMSSNPREEVSLEFSRRGALGFIDRSDPMAPDLLESALWNHGLMPDTTGQIIGNALPLLLALREARRAGGHRDHVLIRGERGTGKELMARYLHSVAKRDERSSPLVEVNSAVFTPNLFTSELFGIESRTATGVDGKVGLIESANSGDLFLDEIADMPPEVQASVLRVLQERQITRVGGRKTMAVDVRFLSATNSDLEDGNKGFRSDLLDRLRLGGTVWLPPLRERLTDIPALIESFIRQAEKQRPNTKRRQISDDVVETLCKYDWPGNIRELRSVIFDAVTRQPDVEHLVPSHLRLNQQNTINRKSPSSHMIQSVPAGKDGLEEILQSITAINFDTEDVTAWSGKLGRIQQEHARLTARLLQAALDSTRRRTPASPKGELQIHPAAKLLTGDSTLTASKAADLIKRLLAPIEDELEGDLAEAHQISLRLRPRSGTSSKRKNPNS